MPYKPHLAAKTPQPDELLLWRYMKTAFADTAGSVHIGAVKYIDYMSE